MMDDDVLRTAQAAQAAATDKERRGVWGGLGERFIRDGPLHSTVRLRELLLDAATDNSGPASGTDEQKGLQRGETSLAFVRGKNDTLEA